MYKLSAKITENLSKLVHNIQIERGLSAGYIVAKDNTTYKEKLLKQHQATDKAYRQFLYYVSLKSDEKDLIHQTIGYKTDLWLNKS